MTKNSQPRILLWDIESGFNASLSFDLYPENIPHHNVLVERHIICISYKWLGEKEVSCISILDDPKRFKRNIHDDYYVVSEFRKLLDVADCQVFHFGQNFDMRMFNARLAYHHLPPVPKIIGFDTCMIARRYFKFNSNRLDYLGKFLGYRGKIQNPKDLWIKCFHGHKPSLRHMAKYSKMDIKILEFVFKRLRPFVQGHQLNQGVWKKGIVCPACSSTRIQWRGWSAALIPKRQFSCLNCGRWSNERKAIKSHVVLK